MNGAHVSVLVSSCKCEWFLTDFLLFNLLVWEPNSGNCLELIFAALLFEKVIIAPDTNYTTPAIRKLMLNMPSPGSFQNIGLLI